MNYPKERQQTNKKICVEPSSSCPRTKGMSFPFVHKFPLCMDSPPHGQGVHIHGSVILLLLIQIYFLYSIYLNLCQCFLPSLVLKGTKCEASNGQPIACALNPILFLYIQRFCILRFSFSTGLFLSHCKNAVISPIFKILHFFHMPHQTTASLPFHNTIATRWCVSCISSLSYSLFKPLFNQAFITSTPLKPHLSKSSVTSIVLNPKANSLLLP